MTDIRLAAATDMGTPGAEFPSLYSSIRKFTYTNIENRGIEKLYSLREEKTKSKHPITENETQGIDSRVVFL
jgi:hypothetical protein